ncbi:MAG: ABC transporter transmembrane domain-containing protein [Clostridia bacterium]|jgi:ABC-type multidrug transport system fused ATPase/permease subunit|nr:ABC transporter transmembrane domain-containing protein [Clostridia bacterium]
MNKAEKNLIKEYMINMKPYKYKYIGYIIMVILQTFVTLFQPIYIGKLLGDMANNNFQNLKMYIIILVSLRLLEFVFKYYAFYLTHYIRNYVNKDVRYKMFKNLKSSNMYMNYNFGQIEERIKEVGGLTRKFDEVIDIGLKIVKFVFIMLTICYFNILLGLITFMLYLVYILSANKFEMRLKIDTKDMKESTEKCDIELYETFGLYKLKKDSKVMESLLNVARDLRVKYNKDYNKMNAFTTLVNIFVEMFLIGFVSYLTFKSYIKIEHLIAYISYLTVLRSISSEILSFNVSMSQLTVSLKRVMEFLKK